jgi:hypothetical protein
MARYGFSGDPIDLVRRAEDGMLPLFESQSGFRGYTIVLSDDEIISFSAWDSAEQAEIANAAATGWVKENMAGEIQLKESRVGEVMLSTTLGIGTKAGITA